MWRAKIELADVLVSTSRSGTGADLVRTPQFVHNTRSSAGIAPEFINCLTTLDRVAAVGLRAPAAAKT